MIACAEISTFRHPTFISKPFMTLSGSPVLNSESTDLATKYVSVLILQYNLSVGGSLTSSRSRTYPLLMLNIKTPGLIPGHDTN